MNNWEFLNNLVFFEIIQIKLRNFYDHSEIEIVWRSSSFPNDMAISSSFYIESIHITASYIIIWTLTAMKDGEK